MQKIYAKLCIRERRRLSDEMKGQSKQFTMNFPLRGPVLSRCLLKKQVQAARQPATAPPQKQSESARGVVRHAVRARRDD
jgi:hypothetical protein